MAALLIASSSALMKSTSFQRTIELRRGNKFHSEIGLYTHVKNIVCKVITLHGTGARALI